MGGSVRVATHAASGQSCSPACCAECPVRTRCLPGGLEALALTRFAAQVEHNDMLAPGMVLYRPGDPVALYTVCRGAIGVVSGDADARLIRVVLPGELAGLSDVGASAHTGTAHTLTPAAVCTIRDDWMALPEAPVLYANLRRAMLQYLAQVDAAPHYLTARTARERLQGLHAALAARLREVPGAHALELRFPLADLGGHLGLSTAEVRTALHHAAPGICMADRGIVVYSLP